MFLAAPDQEYAQIELTWNWDEKGYSEGRNFGHIAYEVDDIYSTCDALVAKGVRILRPLREGYTLPSYVLISIDRCRQESGPEEPWAAMPDQGTW